MRYGPGSQFAARSSLLFPTGAPLPYRCTIPEWIAFREEGPALQRRERRRSAAREVSCRSRSHDVVDLPEPHTGDGERFGAGDGIRTRDPLLGNSSRLRPGASRRGCWSARSPTPARHAPSSPRGRIRRTSSRRSTRCCVAPLVAHGRGERRRRRRSRGSTASSPPPATRADAASGRWAASAPPVAVRRTPARLRRPMARRC